MAQSVTSEQLRPLLTDALSVYNDVRKTAEENLKNAQRVPGYAIAILEIVASNEAKDVNVRIVAAVTFKNFVKYCWELNENGVSDFTIAQQDRTLIKSHLVELMCTVPANIQAQCSEAISLVAKYDFPAKWENLLPDLIKKFNDPNPAVINGVLQTANSIFKRFRYVQRSDDLYKDIIYSLNHIQQPLLVLFQSANQWVDSCGNDLPQLKARFETLRLICRIFFSLNYQDLPEFFEDTMSLWMEGFSKFMQYQNPLLVDESEESEPGAIDKLQAAIVEILSLYADKDEEPFQPHLPNFTQLVWNLTLRVTIYPKHDVLATRCIGFLSSLVKKLMHRDLFKENATLREIIGKIVVPNITIREADEIRFEEDPSEYIATDIEGNESESRRRCSQDLLRAMCRQFETETTAICSEHVGQMLNEYSANPSERWQAKDVAIHLMLGISIKAESAAHGVSQLNTGVDVMNFFATQILPELQDTNHSIRPMLKATAVKFVNIFRNQFNAEQLSGLMPTLIHHLGSTVIVVHTYAAYTIERILTVKEGSEGPQTSRFKFGRAQLQPFLEGLFTSLFRIIDSVEWNENEHVMKCLMRSLSVVDEDIVPVTEAVLEKLTSALARAAKNPRNPQYNHYMFESIAILVKSVCKKDQGATTAFEALLFPPFQTVLRMDVSEFTPYVFQVLAQLLEFKPRGTGLGDSYTTLFAPLLTPALWDRKGNIPALTRLLQAYLGHAAGELFAAGHLRPMLGVFQKLIASRANEQSAFDLVSAIVMYATPESLQPYLRTIFQLLLTRLQHGKSVRYVRLVTQFFALFTGKFGAQAFLDQLNALQAGLALTILSKFWIPRLRDDPPTKLNAKVQVVALTKLLCETPALLTLPEGRGIWVQLFASLLQILSSSGNSLTSNEVDEAPAEIEISYDSAYSRLQFAKGAVVDPFVGVTDAGRAFATALQGLSAAQPSQVQAAIQEVVQIDPKLGAGLDTLLKRAGVTLV